MKRQGIILLTIMLVFNGITTAEISNLSAAPMPKTTVAIPNFKIHGNARRISITQRGWQIIAILSFLL